MSNAPIDELRLTIEALNRNGRGGQARLARYLPVNVRTIRRWLAGESTPNEECLEKIIALRQRKEAPWTR